MRTTTLNGWRIAAWLGAALAVLGATSAKSQTILPASEVFVGLEKIAAAQQEALAQIDQVKAELAIVKVRVSIR
ncbi:MAG: hypothetical protein HY597_02900 [Candidatus Omnitrophica bacterium]|nr:hypothetical protein [Candidatus Omnitrophota bacterium]